MHELSRSLQPRHVTMISIGGIIGAGLFVGSSASIAATGPAIVLSYLITGTLVLLVMRMLGRDGGGAAGGALLHRVRARGLRSLGGIRRRLAVLVLLDDRRAGGGDRRRQHSARLAGVAAVAAGTGAHGGDDRRQSDVGTLVRRVRVLVRLDQGRRHPGIHRTGGGVRLRLPLARRADLRQSHRLRRLRAARLGGGARRCGDGVFLAHRSGDHHHRGGGVGRAGTRGRAHEQLGDRARAHLLRRLGAADRHRGAVGADSPR